MLFIDLDGVLADFDKGYEEEFDFRPDKGNGGDVNWKAVAKIDGFYRHLPPMPDMYRLWDYVSQYDVTILTGIPDDVPSAEQDKRYWCKVMLNTDKVICCKSKEKSQYCNPGDVLVDDWEKYKQLWLDAGGIWITHTSAKNSIRQLKKIGY